MRVAAAFAVPFLTLHLGCSPTVHCVSSGVEPGDACQEISGFGSVVYGSLCENFGQTPVDGGCPEDGKVLGCDLGDGIIRWQYAPTPRDEAQAECEDDSGDALEP